MRCRMLVVASWWLIGACFLLGLCSVVAIIAHCLLVSCSAEQGNFWLKDLTGN